MDTISEPLIIGLFMVFDYVLLVVIVGRGHR